MAAPNASRARQTPTPRRRARQVCANANCDRPADLAHKLILDEGCYCAACAMALVNFALRNPDLLAGVMS